jgi:hypothetical protein
MTRKTGQTTLDLKDDLSIDYALIAVGVGAALAALVYLLLT